MDLDLSQRRKIEKLVVDTIIADIRRHGPIYKALKQFVENDLKKKEEDEY